MTRRRSDEPKRELSEKQKEWLVKLNEKYNKAGTFHYVVKKRPKEVAMVNVAGHRIPINDLDVEEAELLPEVNEEKLPEEILSEEEEEEI